MTSETATEDVDEPISEAPEERAESSPAARFVFLAVIILFFGSGASSLIYQVIWLRMLALIFGSTTFATATVLGVFMGGLALGAFVAGRYADRLARPLLWYGILEAIIGLWALAVPLFFSAAEPLYAAAFQWLHLSVLPFSALRLLMAAVILLVPTACMGATLPLLARFITTNLSVVGKRVGTLYSFNTLGAVFGAICGGFALLPSLGLQKTIFIAAGINLALSAIVALLSRGQEKGGLRKLSPAIPRQKSDLSRQLKVVLLCFGVSGAIAMIYEVAFTRALLMVIGSTTYAFTVMLSTFLIGLALGSLWTSRFADRLQCPVLAFSVVQLMIGIVGFGSLKLFNLLPWWNLTLATSLSSQSDIGMGIRYLLAGLILLPLTLCLGAAFPIVVRASTHHLEEVGRSVSDVYSVNTIGAIIGSLAAGFVLVPNFGTETTLVVCCAGNGILAALLLWTVKDVKRSTRILAYMVAFLTVLYPMKAPVVWDHNLLAHAQAERRKLSMNQSLRFPSMYALVKALEKGSKVVFWKDGASSTVSVIKYTYGTQSNHSLVTNGHVDGSDSADMPIQSLLAGYPLLIKPEMKTVCLIGWGTGVSAGVITRFPVESITAVELEPAVIDGSKFFHHINHAPEKDQRLTLEFNDGRNFLMATKAKFDLIVSEPSNPWQSGVCNLFTKEYFQICHNRLNKGGVLSIWLQTVEVPPENILGVVRAFNDEFQHSIIMRVTAGNIILLGSDEPLLLNPQKIDAALRSDRKVAAELGLVGITSSADLIANLALDEASTRKFGLPGVPNVDDTNKLEYEVARSYESQEFGSKNLENYRRSRIPEKMLAQIDWGALAAKERATILDRAAINGLRLDDPDYASQLSKAALAQSADGQTLRIYGQVQAAIGHPDRAMKAWEQALKLSPEDRETLVSRARASAYLGNIKQCKADSEKLATLEKDPKEKAYLTALCQFRFGSKDTPPEKILSTLGNLLEDPAYVKKAPAVLYLAAVQHARVGHYPLAESLVRRFLAMRPEDVDGAKLLGSLRMIRGDATEASTWWAYASLLGHKSYRSPLDDAVTLMRSGRNNEAVSSLAKSIEFWPTERESYELLTELAKTNSKAQELLLKVQVLRHYLGVRPPVPSKDTAQDTVKK
jgi:spermidine synthase